MEHFKLVRLLEGLAGYHQSECSGPGCDYCAALLDTASAVTADWVVSLRLNLHRDDGGPDPRESMSLPGARSIMQEKLGERLRKGRWSA